MKPGQIQLVQQTSPKVQHFTSQNQNPSQIFSDDQFSIAKSSTSDTASPVGFTISVIIVIKTIVGAGILGLPSVMAEWGWLWPTIFFILIGMGTHQSCRLLIQCRRLCQHSNYSTIGRSAYKSNLFVFFIYFIFVFNNSGICIAESQIFSSSIIDILALKNVQFGAFYTQKWFISLLLLLLIPIVLLKKIQSLKYLTVVGLLAITTFLILVFIDLGETNNTRGYSPSQTFKAYNPNFNIFKAFATVPNVLLAFIFQMNFFPIYKGLQNPTQIRMERTSGLGLLICWFIYYSIAMAGYASYGNFLLNTSGSANSDYIQVVSFYGTNETIKILMNCCFIINSFFTFPIIFFSGRNCLLGMIMLILGKKSIPQFIYFTGTICLFGLIIIIAIVVTSLGAIFNVIGSIASNFIGFIFPCVFYLLLNEKTSKKRGFHFYSSITLLPISLIVLVLGLVAQFV